MMDVNETVVIMSQYIHVSNHYVLYLKLPQCFNQLYLNKTGGRERSLFSIGQRYSLRFFLFYKCVVSFLKFWSLIHP